MKTVHTSGQQITHSNLSRISQRLDAPEHPLKTLIKRRNLYRLASNIRTAMQGKRVTLLQLEKPVETLAQYVKDTYWSNYQVVDALAEKFGFE